MEISIVPWAEISPDSPIPLITRWATTGERMLAARVVLEKGCDVASHRHESEQIACVIRGKVLWRLGEIGSPEYREVLVEAGSFVVLPSNQWHGVHAIEECEIIDVLSPIGAMGIDNQSR